MTPKEQEIIDRYDRNLEEDNLCACTLPAYIRLWANRRWCTRCNLPKLRG